MNLRSPSVSGGRIRACNTPVSSGSGDPGLVLRLPAGQTIDANRFKTLTVEYDYEGPFSTRNGPGGGMVARIFWNDSRGRHPTKGIHLYPNQRWFQIRLTTRAPSSRASSRARAWRPAHPGPAR